LGGAPTYLLTDNEKTVTTRHVARIPVRNPAVVSAAVYYGVVVRTCVVADPESKGGAESTMRIAKADVVPTDANLLPAYETFADLEAACQAAMDRFNGRCSGLLRRFERDLAAHQRRDLKDGKREGVCNGHPDLVDHSHDHRPDGNPVRCTDHHGHTNTHSHPTPTTIQGY